MIGRANFGTALLDGPNAGRPLPLDAAELARRHGAGEDLAGFYCRLLFGTEASPEVRERVGAAEGRKVVAVLLAMPEAQLG